MAAGKGSQSDDDELALIVGRYALGKLTLGQAASQAGVSRWEMRDLLGEAGVELRLGPRDEADAEREVDVALDLE